MPKESLLHLQPKDQNWTLRENVLRVALAGVPNTGKTTLFNALTGLHHHVANYPGITVEKRWGRVRFNERWVEFLDLPGSYSLDADTQDERVVRDVLLGRQPGTPRPDGLVVVVNPFHLERDLYFVSQLQETGIPIVVAVNFWDEVKAKKLQLDLPLLEKRFQVHVVPISALKQEGLEKLKEHLFQFGHVQYPSMIRSTPKKDIQEAEDRYEQIERKLRGVVGVPKREDAFQKNLDRIFLHPFLGPLIFVLSLMLIFQSIFTWALWPMAWIQRGIDGIGRFLTHQIPDPLLQSFLVDGVLAGVGAVIIFLPQILILFFFIVILSDTGYLARGAFLLDRLMSKVGLNGRSFLPLFSCFACAVPGIMATRTIESRKERLITILVSPFMTCSARLPIYAMVTAALIPPITVWKVFNLQGIVFFSMYFLGIVAAMGVALLFKVGIRSEKSSHFFLELPAYRMPHWKTIYVTVRNQAKTFVKMAGSIILLFSIFLWALMYFPRPDAATFLPSASIEETAPEAVMPLGKTEMEAQRLQESFAGRLGRWMEPGLRPLGFDWRIGIGIIVSFAQREVFVSTLAIVHQIENPDVASATDQNFLTLLKSRYTPLTGLSILVFYALACQCMATLAVVRRETGTWKWPVVMFAYMSCLAYGSSFLVFQGGKLLGFQ